MANIEQQQQFWDDWNARTRERERPEISNRQAEVVLGWLRELKRKDLNILEVGCGSGWFCNELSPFGKVHGTDLSVNVLQRSQKKWPHVQFTAGDFFNLPFEKNSFDLVVTLEVLAHVENQQLFLCRISELLKEDGLLFLATQNRHVLENYCKLPPPGEGQVRRWVDRHELKKLVEEKFSICELRSVTPIAHKGFRRVLTSKKLNTAIRPLVGHSLRNYLEKNDCGWTLMVSARKNRYLAETLSSSV
ncbi:class I SAM-dependent methyltransferase [Brucella pituitosa]|uniref:class I SAM-dependent methyltransferase n=1 Tax=Brucella pituitosa TaxID=571256 RepID=UPI000C27A687|nr:class I SAM-dependent methyltransferase [Brucella pituitosa]PJO48156.1 class I SAM-dependent methyltransferase [Brucella pituitosa]